MTEPAIKNIGLGGINIQPGRLRALRPEIVKDLMRSIQERGVLTHPITVRPRPAGGYWLIAGLHRLEAVKRLKLRTIQAKVLTGLTDNQAELVQIDENLVRADLTAAERAMHLARRKEIYEEEHEETKHGGDRKSASKKSSRQNGDLNERFTKDTAKKTGQSERKVQRESKRGKEGGAVLPAIVGTCLDQPNEIDALLKLPPNVQADLIKDAKAAAAAVAAGADSKKVKKVKATTRLKQFRREQRERELGAKQTALPTKKYGLMVTDDAWNFKPYSRETGMDRHAANHYTVEAAYTAVDLHKATKDRLECAAKDCLLAMWATVPHLAIAIDLLRLRGFDYVSHYVWGKDKVGTGHWNRNKHELLLLGVRGNIPCPAPGEQWESLQLAPVTHHSAKPELFLEMLEQYFPSLPKIEFNRRGPARPGWDAWGNEAEQPPAEAAE